MFPWSSVHQRNENLDPGASNPRRLHTQLQQTDTPWNTTTVTNEVSAEACYYPPTNTDGMSGPEFHAQVNIEKHAAKTHASTSLAEDHSKLPPQVFQAQLINHHHLQASPNPTQQASAQQHYESSRHSYQYLDYVAAAAAGASHLEVSNHSDHFDPGTMSLYESRQFPDYPHSTMMHDPHQEQDDNNMQQNRYPSPPPPMSESPYHPQAMDAAALGLEDMTELPTKDEEDTLSPGRSKAIPKPDREVTKGGDGRFVCTWAGCTEEVQSFTRKCEWSKHMDKHDRPYKCPSEGCEKLPGFTYSGGLLRHQREVHNLHGGPRKQLNCPHPTCKRFSGKGFSRQENLNEHLRRVHTDTSETINAEETEDDGSERAGMKRKRAQDEGAELRAEMAQLRSIGWRQHGGPPGTSGSAGTDDLMRDDLNITGEQVSALIGMGVGGGRLGGVWVTVQKWHGGVMATAGMRAGWR
ncbi:hypothetical protein LZ554_000465 [Drepanopeziza brunnea f. sp. 'monogermtubi']|nr:hypothetical protein LZ554_000465 [Drepanopeziza brunnea f. sp. 'monogermtubi']